MNAPFIHRALVALLIIAAQPAVQAQGANPINAARDALKRSMEEAKRQLQGQPAPAPASAPESPALSTGSSQSAAELLGPPQAQSSEPPDNTGTAARSEQLAAATGKYGIEIRQQQGVKPAL